MSHFTVPKQLIFRFTNNTFCNGTRDLSCSEEKNVPDPVVLAGETEMHGEFNINKRRHEYAT